MEAVTARYTRRGNEKLQQERAGKRRTGAELRNQLKANGIDVVCRESISNRKSEYKTVEEEIAAREEAVIQQLRIMTALLPKLLRRLKEIKDPRNPKKIKHKMTLLMVYGILSFVFQMASRREANREMTRPIFMRNLKLFFPEIEDLPHNDTLMRLLSKIEVDEIETAYVDLIRRLIRKKKFCRYLIDNCYPIAIDGTQKLVRNWLFAEQCQERKVHKKDEQDKQYYVYVLEANLAFQNGMTIPLMSEFLDYTKGDTEKKKQDCEQRAFHRLADRIKKEFPRLPIMVLLDGLYPNGPIIEHCFKNKWQFMIVLQDASLKTVWQEFNALKNLEKFNRAKMFWGKRTQCFTWVNGIEYRYGANNKEKVTLHVVVCEEQWKEIDQKDTTKVVTKTSRHAWLSSKPLNCGNIHERCNLGARHRWGIESEFLVEKTKGYQYQHLFSYDWKAIKGYHYLMHFGRLINILAQYSEYFSKKLKQFGQGGLLSFIRSTISAHCLNDALVDQWLKRVFQLRLE